MLVALRATGRLVAPFDLHVPTQGAYYMAYAPRPVQPQRLRDFEAWIVAEALAVDG